MSGEKDEFVGRAKQAAGDLTGDDELKAEGEVDEMAGSMKGALDDAKKKVEGVIDDVKKRFTK